MRLILAHRHDGPAHQLAQRWGADEALLLTPGDLHRERLCLMVDGDGTARAELLSRPEVTSILCRLGGVAPTDLDHVDPEDQEYAAAELDAFLHGWLDAWQGRVVNRPTAVCLNGLGWRPQQWLHAAAGVGLRVRAVRTSTPVRQPDVHAEPVSISGGEPARVTVVGDQCLGVVSDTTAERLRRLARMAMCVLMEAWLDAHGTVVHLTAWPDLSGPAVADSLVAFMGESP
jgi:hypothetical protein